MNNIRVGRNFERVPRNAFRGIYDGSQDYYYGAQRISNDDLNGPCRASKFSREITESRNNGISVS